MAHPRRGWISGDPEPRRAHRRGGLIVGALVAACQSPAGSSCPVGAQDCGVLVALDTNDVANDRVDVTVAVDVVDARAEGPDAIAPEDAAFDVAPAIDLGSDWDVPAGADADGAVASVQIGPAGGQLALGAVALQVPPGAVSTPITFWVEPAAPTTAGALGSAYALGPSGTVFAVPATVSFRFAIEAVPGRDPSRLAVAVLTGEGWSPLDRIAIDTVRGLVSGVTSHLSIFALIATPPTVPDAGPADQLDARDGEAGIDAGAARDGEAAGDVISDARTDVPLDANCTRGARSGRLLCLPPWGWLSEDDYHVFCDGRGCLLHSPYANGGWMFCHESTGTCEECSFELQGCHRLETPHQLNQCLVGTIPWILDPTLPGVVSALPAPNGYCGYMCIGQGCLNMYLDGAVACRDAGRCVLAAMRDYVAGTRHDGRTCQGRTELTYESEPDGFTIYRVPGGQHTPPQPRACCGSTGNDFCFHSSDAGAPTGTCRPIVYMFGDDGGVILCTANAPHVTRTASQMCCEDGCVPCRTLLCDIRWETTSASGFCPGW